MTLERLPSDLFSLIVQDLDVWSLRNVCLTNKTVCHVLCKHKAIRRLFDEKRRECLEWRTVFRYISRTVLDETVVRKQELLKAQGKGDEYGFMRDVASDVKSHVAVISELGRQIVDKLCQVYNRVPRELFEQTDHAALALMFYLNPKYCLERKLERKAMSRYLSTLRDERMRRAMVFQYKGYVAKKLDAPPKKEKRNGSTVLVSWEEDNGDVVLKYTQDDLKWKETSTLMIRIFESSKNLRRIDHYAVQIAQLSRAFEFTHRSMGKLERSRQDMREARQYMHGCSKRERREWYELIRTDPNMNWYKTALEIYDFYREAYAKIRNGQLAALFSRMNEYEGPNEWSIIDIDEELRGEWIYAYEWDKVHDAPKVRKSTNLASIDRSLQAMRQKMATPRRLSSHSESDEEKKPKAVFKKSAHETKKKAPRESLNDDSDEHASE